MARRGGENGKWNTHQIAHFISSAAATESLWRPARSIAQTVQFASIVARGCRRLDNLRYIVALCSLFPVVVETT
jgi:hypothetical protein